MHAPSCWSVLAILLLSAVPEHASAAATDARGLEWKELVPRPLAESAPIVADLKFNPKLSERLQRRPDRVESGNPLRQERSKPADSDRYSLALAWEQREGRRTVAGLDGSTVHITGYVLPLRAASDAAHPGDSDRLPSEFLLVATAAACSHATMPPANQVMHVALSEEAVGQGLWRMPHRGLLGMPKLTLAGKLRTGLARYRLFLVDGDVELEAAYFLEGAELVPSAN